MEAYEISELFTGAAEKNRETIETEIRVHEEALFHLNKQLKELEEGNAGALTPEALAAVMHRHPRMELSVQSPKLHVGTRYQSVAFHVRRGNIKPAPELDNNDIIYVTAPIYGFEAQLHAVTGNVSLRVTKSVVDELCSRAWSGVNGNGFGHPHAQGNPGAMFNTVCRGDNRFIERFERIASGKDKLSELPAMLESLMQWFEYINLSDMYGTRLAPSVPLDDGKFMERRTREVVDELFKLVQLPITVPVFTVEEMHSLLKDVCVVLENNKARFGGDLEIISNLYSYMNTGKRQLISGYMLAFRLVYAMWLIAHNTRSISDCLYEAIRMDVRYGLYCPYAVMVDGDNTRTIRSLLLAPITLRESGYCCTEAARNQVLDVNGSAVEIFETILRVD